MRRLICSLSCLGFIACATHEHALVAPPLAPPTSMHAEANPAHRAQETIALGPVIFEVTIARTAQIFYIVDQLSLWSSHSHKQYARWAHDGQLVGERERTMLDAQKRLRIANGGWGILDHAFASTLSIREAAAVAVMNGILGSKDADQERAVLESFEPLLAPMLNDGQARLESFRDLIKERASGLGRVLGDLQSFAETYTPLPIPLFLVVDPVPHTGGGGYNGGVAWVEVSDTVSAIGTLTHEAIHIIMHDRYRDIVASADACGNGLEYETLNEGLDYAISPGMLHEDNGDPLGAAVDTARKRGLAATDPYVRSQRLGLAVRPALEAALSRKEKLGAFLPKTCEAWRSVVAEAWP